MNIFIKKMGCKVNEYEASSIATSLENNGNIITNSIKECDIAIVLTCAVTGEAEKKSRQAVGSIVLQNPSAKIIVCGCSSQNSPKDYENKNNVVAILGTYNKTKIIDLVSQLESKNIPKNQIDEIGNEYEYYDIPDIDKSRHFVKIQDGCNNFCSYCLIPYIRGRSRSRNIDECVDEIVKASKKSKEIVITGINVSDYHCEDGGLEQLIDRIKDIDVRIRISSMECNIITEQFLGKLLLMKNFCPHFHLPLQSGCDKTLKQMNRHYTVKEFLGKIELINKFFPKAGITTDVIVGFPNETEADFLETINTIKKAKFTDIHAFKYSIRKGTRLSALKPLDSMLANQRQEKLLSLKKELHTAFIQQHLGEKVSVLTENLKNGYYVGYSKEYLKVYIPETQTKTNQIVCVQIESVFLDGVKGNVILKEENNE